MFAIPDVYAYLPIKGYNWTLVAAGEIGTMFAVVFFLALASIFDQLRGISDSAWSVKNDLNRMEDTLTKCKEESIKCISGTTIFPG